MAIILLVDRSNKINPQLRINSLSGRERILLSDKSLKISAIVNWISWRNFKSNWFLYEALITFEADVQYLQIPHTNEKIRVQFAKQIFTEPDVGDVQERKK